MCADHIELEKRGITTELREADNHRCPCGHDSASSQIKELRWHDATHNPHDTARAARGHARLRYAGGSWRSSQTIEFGDPEPARILDREPFACHFAKGGKGDRRNDANHSRHVPARLLDMVGECALGIVDGVSMDSAVGMPVRNEMAVSAAGVMKSKAEIIVARVSGCGFGRRDADSLERKGQRGRHHHDDSNLSQKWLPGKVQAAALSWP